MRNIKKQLERWARRAGVVLVLGLSLGALSACDDLLQVELPAALSNEALENPASVETQVASVIAQYECAMSSFRWMIAGHEDVLEALQGPSRAHRYLDRPDAGVSGGPGCDETEADDAHFQWFMASRTAAVNLYDRLENEWTVEQVAEKERYLAISAIYTGATLNYLGSTFCEVALDGGELMTPDETLALAETWLNRAIDDHIPAAGGDFEMPYEIASSAMTMARGLRAQVRWMAGDDAGALADAQAVPQGFKAWVTRDVGPQRRNKTYFSGAAVSFAGMLGVNDWWVGGDNPVTGEAWPDVIPFTGYLNLGILPNGRAVWDSNQLPVRTEGEYRQLPAEDSAVRDTRVPHVVETTQSGAPRPVPFKYTSQEDDEPIVSWEEMWLLRAQYEGGVTAINLVNDLREAAGLPQVSGDYLAELTDGVNDEAQINNLIWEERRREFFNEGRYYYTKLQRPDVFWFPRAVGDLPSGVFRYLGGVRMAMPNAEYDLNESATRQDRGTLCDPSVQPVILDIEL